MKIAFVTDSGSCISLDYAKQNEIYMVPLYVTMDGTTYKDMIDIDEEEFYRLIDEGKTPSTSQPSIGDFTQLYSQLQAEGYDAAISIHLSAHLSGTVNTAKMAADMTDLPVHVVDTGLVASPMLFAIEEALRLHRQNSSIADIVEGVRAVCEKTFGYIMINDLNFLHRGGRLGATSTLIGTLLQIKPILKLERHRLDLFEKVRTAKKAKEYLFQLLKHDVEENNVREINVVHTNYFEEARTWMEVIKEKFDNIPIAMSTLGTVVGVHSGPKCLGIAWTTA